MADYQKSMRIYEAYCRMYENTNSKYDSVLSMLIDGCLKYGDGSDAVETANSILKEWNASRAITIEIKLKRAKDLITGSEGRPHDATVLYVKALSEYCKIRGVSAEIDAQIKNAKDAARLAKERDAEIEASDISPVYGVDGKTRRTVPYNNSRGEVEMRELVYKNVQINVLTYRYMLAELLGKTNFTFEVSDDRKSWFLEYYLPKGKIESVSEELKRKNISIESVDRSNPKFDIVVLKAPRYERMEAFVDK